MNAVSGTLELTGLQNFLETTYREVKEDFRYWDYWSPMEPPCRDDGWPAEWIGQSDDILDRRGVYLWTLPANGRYQIFHTGCSWKGSLRDRTLAHYNNFFNFSYSQAEKRIRRLDRLPQFKNGKWTVGEKGHNDASSEAIRKFLKEVRIFYLVPRTQPDTGAETGYLKAAVCHLEGAIVRSMPKEQFCTNTVRSTRRCGIESTARVIAMEINKIKGIDPFFQPSP